MNRIGNQFAMGNAVTSQLVRHYLSRFTTAIPEQPLEKPPSSCAVASGLQKYIHHFTILVHRSPQIMLFAADLYENLIDEEDIAITLVLSFQAPGIRGTELDTPEANGLVADFNPSFGQQIFDIAWLRLKR